MSAPTAATAGPDLTSALADPGFTPGKRHFPGLLDLVTGEDEELSSRAERALRRAGTAALPAALARAGEAAPNARAALIKLIGRVAAAASEEASKAEAGEAAEVAAARAFLLARLRDEDARTRRLAAVALGKLGGGAEEAALEAALLEAAREEQAPEVRRAVVAALGRVGGREALATLEGLALDPELAGVQQRAELMVQRTLARARPSEVAADRAPERAVRVAVRCRRGLERVLLEELAGLGVKEPRLVREAPGGVRVELSLKRPLSDLFQARTMLSFALPLPERTLRPGEDAADAAAERLLSREASAVLRGFTEGQVRYRLAWAGGGKRRALTWKVAQSVAAREPDLVNDPRESAWEVLVYEAGDRIRVELSPNLPDPRFAYRRGDVPAASHPTIAAALARIAGAREDDVVWDPFVGSGLELCERAILGPFRQMVGSDRDPAALAVARENLAAAGVAGVELVERDALKRPTFAPTLIITNPPMGRRLHRQADLGDLLERFVAASARVLAPGGRLVWLSPMPARTADAAERAGLRPELLSSIDMGGFEAQIQVLRKEIGEDTRERGEGTRGRGEGTRERGEGARTPARREPAAQKRPGSAARAQGASVHGEQRNARAHENRHDKHDDHAAPGRLRRGLGDDQTTARRRERGRGRA